MTISSQVLVLCLIHSESRSLIEYINFGVSEYFYFEYYLFVTGDENSLDAYKKWLHSDEICI